MRAETLLFETSSEVAKAALEELRTRLEEEFPVRTLEEQLLLECIVHAILQKQRCLQFETKELRQEFIFHGPVPDRLRYATSADKRMFRVLNELKRLQKEYPPHPDNPDTAPQAEGE